MNNAELARQTVIAVRLLEEAVYDVLLGAKRNGGESLQPHQIAYRVGLESHDAHFSEVVRFALKRMEQKGRVRNLDRDGTTVGHWEAAVPFVDVHEVDYQVGGQS